LISSNGYFLLVTNCQLCIAVIIGAVVFSGVCLSVRVCLSVNAITREPLKISSQNFHGIILWSKGQTCLKMAIYALYVQFSECTDIILNFMMFVSVYNAVSLSLLLSCILTVEDRSSGVSFVEQMSNF